jgi:hypothetical protein
MKDILKSLNLTQSAQDFLIMLWNTIQFFDDVIDSDKELNTGQIKGILVDILVRLPLNAFYIQNQVSLIPVIANAILTWNASDIMEYEGTANERSFVWRASYYQVVLQVYALVHGMDNAMNEANRILNLYGESYEDYKTEFKIP